jgi:hypothetical protein
MITRFDLDSPDLPLPELIGNLRNIPSHRSVQRDIKPENSYQTIKDRALDLWRLKREFEVEAG